MMKLNRKTAALISVTIILALCSVACAPANEVVLATTPEPTPTATATATPTLSPAPTPTLTPSPTPMPELTYEQKKALLGIDEDFTSCLAGHLVIFNMSFNNVSGRIWCISYSTENENEHEIFSVCNMEYLFSLQLPPNTAIFLDDYSKYLSKSNENFKNLKLENSTGVLTMANLYDYLKVDYNNNQFIKDLSEKFQKDPEGTMSMPFSEEQIVDLIINSAPQDEIIPFWVYTPGAQIPEELKGIYSEEEYPPAPAE